MPNNHNSQKTKHVFLVLRVAVVLIGVICGVIWVSRGQRWEHLVNIFKEMNLWVFAAALCIFIGGQVIVGLRWWLLLRTQSIYIGFWVAVRLHYLGLFYNNFMPSSVGGDLIRAWYVTRHTDKKFEAALSVFVDRVIGLLSTLVIAVFFYSVFLRGKSIAEEMTVAQQGGGLKSVAQYRWIFVSLVVFLAAVFGGLLLYRPGRAVLAKMWVKIRMHSLRAVGKLKDAIIVYCKKPLVIFNVFALTVFLQLATITGFWLLGRNLGIEAGLKYYYIFFTLTWVLGAVPVSIGGAVVVEASLAYLFVHFAGVGQEPAAALAISQRAVWMLASLPGAAIHLMGAHLPKDFSIDYKKSIN